jgi:hypothetical protein
VRSRVTRISRNFCTPFFYDKSYVLILTNYGLSYILADFFTNSSGQPANIVTNVYSFILYKIGSIIFSQLCQKLYLHICIYYKYS